MLLQRRGYRDWTYDDLVIDEMSAASVVLVEEVGQDARVDGRRRKHYQIAEPQQGPWDDICQSGVVVAVPVHGEFVGDWMQMLLFSKDGQMSR